MKKISLVILPLVLLIFSGCQSNGEKNSSSSENISQTNETSISESEDESEGIVFDVEDSEICEDIIDQVTKKESLEREKLDIHIFTNDDYTKRDKWLVEIITSDNKEVYFELTKDSPDIQKIDKDQYDKLFKEITSSNHTPEKPLYSEENNQ
ncbi:hypothetical protein ATZ33_16155 [Enterococcus silesiacus]|uniref:Uncharacterized protein n=1 Tax=Enterococcus silesiacus TaxID=332949 RepID=A0A0S3KF11_9ENTE|nr:hypothetical protein [Enterococcus silesiacus]ALS02853.1 hypothetical protein ATZ33_16155 [Enterococcus silesiacus]OJG91799.1 hypothetical protein RV15_GL000239 [Enterococcus silesiacus]